MAWINMAGRHKIGGTLWANCILFSLWQLLRGRAKGILSVNGPHHLQVVTKRGNVLCLTRTIPKGYYWFFRGQPMLVRGNVWKRLPYKQVWGAPPGR
jgi:hypothetical protein